MTMGQSWAYNPTESHWKSAQQLITNLVNVVSGGGNYLLNVGPRPDGAFPPEAIQRLQRIGQWMQVNGEAIHGTTYAPPLPGFRGRVTRREDRLYLHVLEWPATGQIEIAGFPGSVSSVELLSGGPLAFVQDAGRLEIQVPAQAPDPAVSVIVVRVKE